MNLKYAPTRWQPALSQECPHADVIARTSINPSTDDFLGDISADAILSASKNLFLCEQSTYKDL